MLSLRHSIPAACLLALASLGLAQSAPAPKDDPLTAPRTAWFRQARFGLFIHWGLYAVPAGFYHGQPVVDPKTGKRSIGEWLMRRANIPVAEYEQFAKEFNPTKFDAKAWAQAAKDAGMKYIVITSKHHDGFCMFDTKQTDYNIVKATPYARDPMKDLAAECKKAGIKLCFYYSIMDWHHPDQWRSTMEASAYAAGHYPPGMDAAAAAAATQAAPKPDFDRYKAYMRAQLKELLTNYGDIGILWFDGQWIQGWDAKQGQELEAYLRTLQPDLIVNNRIGKKGKTDGDYETPEQSIPRSRIPDRLWETCMTMNDTWGFRKDDHDWKSTADLIHKLADIASKGGNFLLNVGPTAEGEIPAPSLERLKEIGAWMQTNGEAIYGTTAADLPQPAWGRLTRKTGENVLYAIVFDWPKDGELLLPGSFTVTNAQVLGAPPERNGFSIQRPPGNAPMTLRLNAKPTSPYATVLRLTYTGNLTPATLPATAPAKLPATRARP